MGAEFNTQPVGSTVAPCPLAKKPIHWLEIELIGEDSRPIPLARYRVRLPDGTLAEGYLDNDGFARLDGIATAGECQVNFPEFDSEAWEFVETLGAKAAGGSS